MVDIDVNGILAVYAPQVFAPKPLLRMVAVGGKDSRDVGCGKGTQV